MLAAFLGPAIVFGPMLLRGETLFWGTAMLQFVPWRTLAIQIVASGHLPLWNPWLGTGAPLLANYQSALLYPPNWILALAGAAWGHGLLTMLHLVWAGAGMGMLSRRLGQGTLAQTIAALSFGLSGALVARGSFQTMIAAGSWLPWLVIVADRLAESAQNGTPARVRGTAILLAGLVLAMQWLAGHAQFAWYSLLFAGAWAALRGGRAAGWPGAARALLALGAAGILGLALAAAQILPTAEYLLQSSREAGLDPNYALTYSLWPWRLLGWVLPGLFGSPATGDYWGYASFWEDALYIGVLPFLLALIGSIRAVFGRGPHARTRRFLVAVIIVSLLLALGKNTPIYLFLFEHVPTFDLFQAPARWGLLAVFSAALLASYAADGWRGLTGWGLYCTRLATAGAAACALSAWFLGPRLGGVEPSLIRAFALAGATTAIAGALALLRRASSQPTWALAVGCFVLFDLVLAARGLNPSAPLSLYRGRTGLARETGDARLFMPSDVEYELKFRRYFRFDTYDPGLDWRQVREAGLPNTLLLEEIASVDNFDPLQPSRYVALRSALEQAPRARQDRLLALMDVGWRAEEALESPSGVRYVPVAGAARARMVPEARWVEGPEAALEAVSAEDFDPDRMVILEATPPADFPRGASGGSAEVLSQDNPNRVEVTVETQGGGWLILSDAFYPGWQARVDGADTSVYPADSLLRAVRVPPGEHRVEFNYRPASFWIGAGISALAWVLLGAVWVRWRKG